MKNKITIGLMVASIILTSALLKADCPQPAPAGKCGLASEGASCANGCTSTTGTQTDIKNCTGPAGAVECKANPFNWTATFNYYVINLDSEGNCNGCSQTVKVYAPEDTAHPPTTGGTCHDVVSGTQPCGGA